MSRVKRFPEFQIFLQPIVDLKRASIFAYEALCRGLGGESYPELVGKIDPNLVSRFDERIMIRALRLAAALRLESIGAKISLNMGPTAEVDLAHLLQEAKRLEIKPSSIVIELTEGVRMDQAKLVRIVAAHRAAGVVVALDDFGGGYAGLNVLATCVPDVLKIDSGLIRNIHSSPLKKTIVGAFAEVCRSIECRHCRGRRGDDSGGRCAALPGHLPDAGILLCASAGRTDSGHQLPTKISKHSVGERVAENLEGRSRVVASGQFGSNDKAIRRA